MAQYTNDELIFRDRFNKLGRISVSRDEPTPAEQFAKRQQQLDGQEEDGFLSSVSRGLASGGAGVIQGQAQLGNLLGIGDGETAKYLDNVIQNNARKKEYSLGEMIPFSSDYWTNPEGVAYDVANAAGSSGVMMGEVAGVLSGLGALGATGAAAAGTAAGTGALGRIAAGVGSGASRLANLAPQKLATKLGEAATNRGFTKLGKALSGPLGQLYALNIAKTPIEVTSEMGSAGAEALERGADIDEARKEAFVVGAIQTPLLALSNTLESAGLGGLFSKEIAEATGKKAGKMALSDILGSITKEALQNSWEEGMQQSTHDFAAGREGLHTVLLPFMGSDEARQQMAVGGITGAAIGGGHAALKGAYNEFGDKPSDENSEAIIDNVNDNDIISDNFSDNNLHPVRDIYEERFDDLSDMWDDGADNKVDSFAKELEAKEHITSSQNDSNADTKSQTTQYPTYPKRDSGKQRNATLRRSYERSGNNNLLRENEVEKTNETQQPILDDVALENHERQHNGDTQGALAEQNKVQPDVLPSVEPITRNNRAVNNRAMNEDIAASGQSVPAVQPNKSKNLTTKGNTVGAVGTTESRNASKENVLKTAAERKQAKADTKQQKTIAPIVQTKQTTKPKNPAMQNRSKENVQMSFAKGAGQIRFSPNDNRVGLAVQNGLTKKEIKEAEKHGFQFNELNGYWYAVDNDESRTFIEKYRRKELAENDKKTQDRVQDKQSKGTTKTKTTNNESGEAKKQPTEVKAEKEKKAVKQGISGKEETQKQEQQPPTHDGTITKTALPEAVMFHKSTSTVKISPDGKEIRMTPGKGGLTDNEKTEVYKVFKWVRSQEKGKIGYYKAEYTPDNVAFVNNLASQHGNIKTDAESEKTLGELNISGMDFYLISRDTSDKGKILLLLKKRKNDRISKDVSAKIKGSPFIYDTAYKGYWAPTSDETNAFLADFINKNKNTSKEATSTEKAATQQIVAKPQPTKETTSKKTDVKPKAEAEVKSEPKTGVETKSTKRKVETKVETKSEPKKETKVETPTTTKKPPNEPSDFFKKFAKRQQSKEKPNQGFGSVDELLANLKAEATAEKVAEAEVKSEPKTGVETKSEIKAESKTAASKVDEFKKDEDGVIKIPAKANSEDVVVAQEKNLETIKTLLQDILDKAHNDESANKSELKKTVSAIFRKYVSQQRTNNHVLSETGEKEVEELAETTKEKLSMLLNEAKDAELDSVRKFYDDEAGDIAKKYKARNISLDEAKKQLNNLYERVTERLKEEKQIAPWKLDKETNKYKNLVNKKIASLERQETKRVQTTAIANTEYDLSADGKKVYDWVKQRLGENPNFEEKDCEAAAAIIAFRAETWSELFNKYLDTKYTPLEFAQRYKFQYNSNYGSVGGDTRFRSNKKGEWDAHIQEISLNKDAGVGTLFHEFGHAFFNELVMVAEKANAPKQLKQDLKTIRKWMAESLGKEYDSYEDNYLLSAQSKTNEYKLDDSERFAQAMMKTLPKLNCPVGWVNDLFKDVAKRIRAWCKKVKDTLKKMYNTYSEPEADANNKYYSLDFEVPAEVEQAINRMVFYSDNSSETATKKLSNFEDRNRELNDILEKILDVDNRSDLDKVVSQLNKPWIEASDTRQQKATLNKLLDVANTAKSVREAEFKIEFPDEETKLPALIAKNMPYIDLVNDTDTDPTELLSEKAIKKLVEVSPEEHQGIVSDVIDEGLTEAVLYDFIGVPYGLGEEYNDFILQYEQMLGENLNKNQKKTIKEAAEAILEAFKLHQKMFEANEKLEKLQDELAETTDDVGKKSETAKVALKTETSVGPKKYVANRESGSRLSLEERVHEIGMMNSSLSALKDEDGKILDEILSQLKQPWFGDSDTEEDKAMINRFLDNIDKKVEMFIKTTHSALLADTPMGKTLYQLAYHGSPHIITEPLSTRFLGTGEGNQSHGWGLYFAKSKKVSDEYYRKRLSKNKTIDVETVSFIDPESGKQVDWDWYESKEKKYQEKLEKLKNQWRQQDYPDDIYEEIVEYMLSSANPRTTTAGLTFSIFDEKSYFDAKELVDWVIPDIRKDLEGKGTFVEPASAVARFFGYAGNDSLRDELENRPNLLSKLIDMTHDALSIVENVATKKINEKGSLLQVELPENDVLLAKGVQFNQQPHQVQDGLKKLMQLLYKDFLATGDKVASEGEKHKIINFANVSRTNKISSEFLEAVINGQHNLNSNQLNRIFELDRARTNTNYIHDNSIYNNIGGYLEVLAQLKGVETLDARSDKLASLALNAVGIKGLRYYGTRDKECFVIFDDNAIAIKQRYEAAVKKHEDELRRSKEDVIEKFQKLLNTNNVKELDDGSLEFTLKDGRKFVVDVEEKILVNAKELESAKATHGYEALDNVSVEGFFRPLAGEHQAQIGISLGSARNTEVHEITHAAIAMALDGKEKSALFDRAKQIAKEHNLKADSEEIACDAVRDFVTTRENGYITNFSQEETERLQKTNWGRMMLKANTLGRTTALFTDTNRENLQKTLWGRTILAKYKIQTAVGKLLRKIYDFLKKAQVAFTGVENFHNVARKIELGDVWGKDSEETDNQNTKYSVRKKENTEILPTRTYANERHKGETYDNTVQKLGAAIQRTEEEKGLVSSAKDWLKKAKENYYKQFVDKYDSLEIFDKAVAATGVKLKGIDTILGKMQMVANASSGATKALVDGDEAMLKAIGRKYGIKDFKATSLSMIMERLGADRKAGKYKEYIASTNKDGDTSTQAYINALDTLLVARTTLESARNHKKDYEDKVADWKKNGSKGKQPEYKPYVAPNGMSEQELADVVRNAPKELLKHAVEFKDVTDNLLDIMKATGLITPENYSKIKERYKAYAPLMRDFQDTEAVDGFIDQINAGKGLGNVSNPLKKRSGEGSQRDVISPLATIVKSTAAIVARAERNMVGREMVRQAEKYKLNDYCQEVSGESGDSKNCIFTVMIDGKKHSYKTIPELYPAIVAAVEPLMKIQMALLTKPASWLRAGSTLSPSFVIRNFLRDTLFAGISSKNGFVPFYDSIKGMHALFKNKELRGEFYASGVISSNYYGDEAMITKSLNEMAGGKEWSEMTAWDIIKSVWNKGVIGNLEGLSNVVEAGTRMGEFMKAKEKGKSTEQAAHDAVEVTLNFTRSGATGQQVNRAIPFFNACIQGSDKLYRLFKENPRLTMLRIGTYIVLPSMLLWLLNHDEDWYKELDPSVKATNWILPNRMRIPKPQEAGVLFGTGVEAFLDEASNQDPKAIDDWAKTMISNYVPSVIPTLLLPFIEWQANYSFFRGKPVVNKSQERLPDELQYGPYTSEVAKAVGDNPIVKLSPAKIDNMWRSVTGTLGMFLIQAPDLLVAEKRNLPSKKITEMAVARDFLVNDMNLNRTMSDFYSLQEVAAKQHAGYGKKGKPTTAVAGINTANRSILKIQKEIRDVTNSRRLTPARKRAMIDRLLDKQKRIASNCIKKYGKYFDY